MTKFFMLFLGIAVSALCQEQPLYSINVINNSVITLQSAAAEVPLDSLKKYIPNFNQSSIAVYDGSTRLQSEINNEKNLLIFLADFKAGESKKIEIRSYSGKENQHVYTQAYLGKKVNYVDSAGYYTNGEFIPVEEDTVPLAHFAHDALYQFEGPGWESDKVGYRLYLDSRNRTDIFGKKTPEAVLHTAGKSDLVSDGKESYQKMLPWGQDIFKVGTSLGIGSPAAYYDSVVTISDYKTAICKVHSGNLISGVETFHSGWKAGGEVFDVSCRYSIKAGSRLTHVSVTTDKPVKAFSTGLAKHSGTELLKSENKTGWNFIALWGNQTIINDNLGIALFYRSEDAVKVSEDQVSYIVVLNPGGNNTSYYFAAAWEQEQNGIKSIESFKEYLEQERIKLNNPLSVFYLSE